MFKKPPPGSFAKEGTIADEIHCMSSWKASLYDDIYEKLNVLLGGNKEGEDQDICMFDDITTDSYDNSLELKGVRDNTEIKQELIDTVFEMGFDRFWVNFIDGSEKYFYKKP